jgi:two-component system sensor histidine kinase BaeS
MRSITHKLVLAFIGVSFLSVALIVLVTRWTTGNEFSKFVLDTNQANLVSLLSNYYEDHQSWVGLQIEQLRFNGREPFRPLNRQQHYAIADENGVIVVSSGRYHVGDTLSISNLNSGIPINVNDSTIGTLLLEDFVFRQDPREILFLQRLNGLLMLIAVGTAVFALILGTWLSRTLTRPIRELTAATHEVSQGKLGITVPVRSQDELGDLATSFNRMNTDLERSLKLRRQMTADIAHELRTPLSLILGHAEAVHDGVLPPTEKSFEIIREEALRLEHLIDDLRVLSLADAGELSLNLQPTEVEKWIEDILLSYDHMVQTKNIQLDVHIDPDLPEILMDSARMTQVLSNVMDNALRYTPEGGQISIFASVDAGGLELKFHDSGPGVTREDLIRIFDRFYRIDPSRQRDEGGSGLGLAIAKSLVEKHGGSIFAESNPGEGLQIIIKLPPTINNA